jgi:hypothetical protein
MEFTAQSRQVKRRHATMGKAVLDATERAVFLFRAKQEKIIAMSFFEFVRQCQAPDVLREFRRLYENKDYQKILKLTEDQLVDFSLVSPKVVLNSAIWENQKLRESLDVKVQKIEVDPSIDISFNIGDPEAARLLRQSALAFIREITEAQRDIIRATIAQALEQGLSPTDAARLFRRNIGLTTFQMGSVDNYRRLLESGNRDALNRVLRDRRFDSSVNNAINRNIQLSASQIERMVERYHSRMLDMRAETIARTEGLSAVNSGRHAAMNQMMNKLDLEEARIERTWRCSMDGRQRDTHGSMNGQIRGAKEPFLSPSGAKLMYPGDRSAPAAEVINCRCVPLIRIKEPHEMVAQLQQEATIAGLPKQVIPGTGLGTDLFIRHPVKDYYIPAGSTKFPVPTGLKMSDYPRYKIKEFVEAFKEISKQTIRTVLSEAEREALSTYTKSGYSIVNKALVEKRLRDPNSISRASIPVADDMIKHIDSSMQKVSLSENTVVYRATGSRVSFMQRFPDLEVGEYLVLDQGFASTTLSRNVANSFNKQDFVMEILMPKGSRAIPMYGISGHTGELEFIIDRNATFIVRKVTKNVITLELVAT